MARGPLEESDRSMRLMGTALVTWSEIENLWRMTLPALLFRDFKHPQDETVKPGFHFYGDGKLSVSEARGYALWDSLNNGAAQLDLVLGVAPLALTGPRQAKGLAKLLGLGKETHEKRSKRNALAHSAFEQGAQLEVGELPGTFVIGDQILRPAPHAHSAIRGQDLAVVLPQFIEEFKQLRENVRDVWTWLKIGVPADAGAPLPDKGRQRSKASKADQAGRA